MIIGHFRLAAICTSLMLAVSLPLAAQQKAPRKPLASKSSEKSQTPSLLGTWQGTATVPLPDSAIVVPVSYNFTQSGTTIGGTAMVPGQGSGPISNVVREGANLKFRVTAPENRLLEHDVKIGADGTMEGMVNLNNQPIAKIKVTFKAAPPK